MIGGPAANAGAGPQTVIEGVAEINGAQIHYQISGEGQPLVLIHGYPLSGRIFKEQVAGLSDRFQVVTLDLRDFGASTALNDNGSIRLYARDVLALLDQLGIGQAIIGGHSMGASSPWRYIAARPNVS